MDVSIRPSLRKSDEHNLGRKGGVIMSKGLMTKLRIDKEENILIESKTASSQLTNKFIQF